MALDFETCYRAVVARDRTAKRLLAETDMPLTDVAFASGFASADEVTTSQETWLSLRLTIREPFGSAGLLGFLRARAIPGVEQVSAGRYARTVRTAAGTGVIELLPRPGQGHVLLRVQLDALSGVGHAVYGARRLLDADADPAAIDTALAADRVLAPLVRARPGLRVPGTYDGFELAVRAVLGQQVSVAAARTFAGRLAARFGTQLPALTPGDGPGEPRLTTVFPTAAELADADLSGLGLTTGRQRTVRTLAQAAATGRLNLGPGADPAEIAARLAELPGIGPWTISYILLRSGDPDAFPGTDLGVRRAMERLGCPPAQPARWRPWRGYAAMHLWTWYADGAAQAAGPASARVGRAVASSDRSGRRAAAGRR